MTVPPVQSRPTPTITFTDRYDFALGGERFELIGCPGAETEDSLVVWLPARRICFTAAFYSDIQERLFHQQWMYAYSDCMLRLYDQIRKTPDVLAALIELR